MRPKKLKESYVAEETLDGFYKSIIPVGTVLYPHKLEDTPIHNRGHWHWRFVFDTIKGAQAHDLPKGNKRVAIWFTRGKFENKIKAATNENK